MAKITLRGKNEGLEVEFNQSRHVELTGGFYEKSDTENVAVVNSRYYRKNSPLIAQLSESIYGKNRFCMAGDSVFDYFTGELIHVSESILTGQDTHCIYDEITSDLKFAPFHSKTYYNHGWSIIRRPDRDFRAIECSVLSSSISNPLKTGEIVLSRGGRYVQSKYSFRLHSSYRASDPSSFLGQSINGSRYAKSVDDLIESDVLLNIEGGLHWKKDIQFSYSPSGERYKPIKNATTGYRFDNRKSPFSASGFILKADIKELMIAAIRSKSRSGVNTILRSNWFGDSRIDADFESKSYLTKFGIRCGTNEDLKLIDRIYDLCESMSPSSELMDFVYSNNWMSTESHEPTPSLYTGNNLGNQGGDFVYFNAQKVSVTDEENHHTGGIGYTFGVEIETEKGLVPLEVAKLINVSAVGDRSVGGLEYVTGVMSGNSGMNNLMSIVDTISKYCVVADTCGLHVHIGGDGGKWTPKFDKEFAVMAVKVGCAIEKELFSLLPSNRMDRKNSNGQPYCGSILEYSDISIKNWKDRLFHYVFGRGMEDSSEGFSELDSLVERRHQVNRWGAGRYKWLNLINCTTDNSGRRNGGGFQTIEFRAFNGTLNKDDIKAFVLLSLSFVEFIERYRSDIMKLSNISIMGIAGSTMSGDALEFFTDWYEKRVERVGRVIDKLNNKSKSKSI